MFCSTVIPTIGRSTLSRAVVSVLDQEIPGEDFEIIVVNDSGQLLPSREWQRFERVRVINTNQRERSVARNTGAAIASGRFLHFLDDDDWLAPGALRNLRELSRNDDAGWYYGSSQLINRQGKPLLQLHHQLNGNCFIQVMAGEWIPLQASLINAQIFFKVGGFNPLISGPEDIDLLRRIALYSDIAGTSAITAYIEWGREGSSTNYDFHAESSRYAREFILDEKRAFNRMRSSAQSSYLHGRIARAYFTSMIWNMNYNRLWTAASRASLGMAGLLLAGVNLFSFDFWRAMFNPYFSEAFSRGLQSANASS